MNRLRCVVEVCQRHSDGGERRTFIHIANSLTPPPYFVPLSPLSKRLDQAYIPHFRNITGKTEHLSYIWDHLGNHRELQLVNSYLGIHGPTVTHASYPNDPRNPSAER